MTTFTESVRPQEWLRSEAPGTRSRSVGTMTVAGGAGHVSGTVVGRITASGKLVAYSNSASDGSQAAVGILVSDLKGQPNGDVQAVIVDADCEVEAALLTGLDSAGRADLALLGFKLR